MKTKILLLLMLCATLNFVSAQNDYPVATGSNPTIDGGWINMLRPITSGGWARGLFFYDEDLTSPERWAGVGLLGTGGVKDYLFMGHGESSWSSGLGIYIATDGDVGIGERFPSERFEVNGTSLFRNTNFFGTDTNNRIGIVSYNNTEDKFLIRGTSGHRLSLGANNTNDRVLIDLNGNVGIGSLSPEEKLTVNGTAKATKLLVDDYSPRLYLKRNTNNGGYIQGIQTQFADGSDNWWFGNSGPNVWRVNKGGYSSPVMLYLNESGNMGLGTETPDAKLDVQGTINSNIKLSTQNSAYFLTLEAKEDAANRFELKSAGQEILGSKVINSTTPTYINGYYGLALSSGTGNVSDNSVGLFVAPGARVGIGTFSPSIAHKLHVKGGAKVDSYLTLGANGSSGHTASGVILESHDDYRGTGTFSQGQTAEWFWGNPYTDHDGTFIIARGPQGTGTALAQKANALFTMTDAGDVSIGTTDVYPDYKLSVAGKGRFEEVKVQPEIEWMDIVFEEDYDLRTLEEVKKYIDENGHLPDIPSAEEVGRNGFNLGEMDANLLRKIEELTLYMLENEEEKKRIIAQNELLKMEMKEMKEMMKALIEKK